MSRDLGLAYKSAFVLVHKLREAMAEELKGRVIGGEGKTAEVDGGYFGGYVKPANLHADRKDRRLSENQSGKRKVVVIVRERDGNSVPAVFGSEGAALNWIKSRIQPGTVVNADEAASWNGLHEQIRNEAHQPSRGLQPSTALARTWRRNISAACAGLRSATITTSPAPICSGTPRKRHGAKITAACRMASRSATWRHWR